MKRLFSISLFGTSVLLLFAACSSEASRAQEANTYFARVIAKTDQVVAVFNSFIQRSTYNEIDSMKLSHTLLEKVSKANTDTISAMEDFDGSSALKTEAIEYIKALQSINANEFKELIRIYSIPEDQLTDGESGKLDSVSNSMDNKMTLLSNRFLKAQTTFAKAQNIKLDFDYELDSSAKKGVDTSVIVH